MTDNYQITGYCRIKDSNVVLNGEILFENSEDLPFSAFMKSIYKGKGYKYPKYYKMDNMSRLAFLTSELLLGESDFTAKHAAEEIGIIMANSTSSLDTDSKYYDTIRDRDNYFPSPALFVYTLPNIMIGEMCIKNGIKGENIFLITEKFDAEQLTVQAKLLLAAGRAQSCILGWVNYLDEKYEAIMFLLEKQGEEGEYLSLNKENLQNLYAGK